uniref:Casein kinase I like hhp1 n=1 Tax=Talaromyces marneffei PM1 TaxID=1077442 RepID=A0A093ULP7_TALMA
MAAIYRVADGEYRLEGKIGSGTFSQGTHVKTGEKFAIKLESVHTAHPQLIHEVKVHKSLAHVVGTPLVGWCGTEGDHHAMVMNHLGRNLEELLHYCNGQFSLKTVLLLADRLISIIESVHSESYIHRDIGPHSVFIGSGMHDQQVYLTNFGLAKSYRDPETRAHIPTYGGKALVGTARYASLHVHRGIEHSRRDDMESLGYMLLYFLRGSLPWQGVKAESKEELYRKIGDMKIDTEALCQGLPSAFRKYFKHVRFLKFDAKPDYSYLRKIFCDLFVDKSFQKDYSFDWSIYQTWATMNSKAEDEKESASRSNTVVPSPQQIQARTSVALELFEQAMNSEPEDEKESASRSNTVVPSPQQIQARTSVALELFEQAMNSEPEDEKESESPSNTVVPSLQQIPNPESDPLRLFDQAITESRSNTVALSLQQIPNLPSVAQLFERASEGMLLQPKTPPITEEQLRNEVRAIYAGLIMVEKKCIEIIQQNENPAELTLPQLQALAALFRMLLYKYVDFFLVSNHPAASDALKGLAKAHSIPARLWRYGIHSVLELLRKKLPLLRNYMSTFIYMAYAIMELLLESVPQFEEIWIECLGDLARYRMAIEEADMRDREMYRGVARYWFTKAAVLNPDIGRVQHHLAVLARPNVLQQLFYYSKALISVQPFTNARDSILLLFEALFDPAKAATKYSKYCPEALTIFVEAHGVLFTRQDVPTFLRLANEFLSQLDRHAGIVGPLFREQGPSCRQIGIALRVAKDYSISSSGEAGSLASHFASSTLHVILGRLGDPNMLPSIHVSLAFLWCLAMVPESTDLLKIRDADFPVQNPESPQELPEDRVINGLTWARLYYPPGFFPETLEDDKGSIGLQSEIHQRTQRCLWLAMQITKFECWMVYDLEQRRFSATEFACKLAALSKQHQLLHPGPETKTDTDELDVAVLLESISLKQ